MMFDYNDIVQKYNVKLKGVIHIGGHVGEEIPLYKQQTNNIHIFEPLKECFDQIDNTVNKYNIALGSNKGVLQFNVANNHQSSSFLKPKTHLTEHTWVTFNHTRFIQIDTLDSYGITDCNLLNIDVQGYELEVLKGAINTLTHVDYILTEVNEKELYENCAQLNELDSFLADFTRVETTMTNHGWGDAFYIRKEII
jgi:FkbM family methyltransferase